MSIFPQPVDLKFIVFVRSKKMKAKRLYALAAVNTAGGAFSQKIVLRKPETP
jgi:hypothetical protein